MTMQAREFVYTGEPVPELNVREHAAFLMNLQKAILFSLEKRKLMTPSQRERCILMLEEQFRNGKGSLSPKIKKHIKIASAQDLTN